MAKSSSPKAPTKMHRDLLKIFDALNVEFFSGTVTGGIGWRNLPLIDEATCSLALCLFQERFIKVSNVLDDSRVPIWYLKFVVYHEMLHLHLGPQQFSSDEYAFPHNDRFKSLEMRHPEYQKASEFEDTKLPHILRSWKAWKTWNRDKRKKQE